MNAQFDFTGKNVFIFGGTSGINLGIAQSFAINGATVAVASRIQAKVDAAVAVLKELGSNAHGYSLDVRQVEDVKAAVTAFHDTVGPIDILVSGAAGNFPAPALGMSANAFRSVIDIDLMGTFHVCQSAYDVLRKPGASIINISAPQAYVPMIMQSHVCAAKAGVDMITRTLALEWGGAGVRVNSVVPGPIDNTEGMDRLAPTQEARAATIQSVPLGRMGEASEIAHAAMFLSSDAAAYISGVVLPVDGGWSLGGAPSAMAAKLAGG